jgi:hypothetical protein
LRTSAILTLIRRPLSGTCDCSEDARRQIEAIEQRKDVWLFQVGIFEKREQSFLAGIVHQGFQFVTRS